MPLLRLAGEKTAFASLGGYFTQKFKWENKFVLTNLHRIYDESILKFSVSDQFFISEYKCVLKKSSFR